VSIHQEATIAASPERVYAALTSGEEFAAATGMPAEITDREGDPFTVFGGRVEGRQIELVRGRRVVQAWRFGAEHPEPWEPGAYSVVRFTLKPEGDATRLIIDHDGIPSHAEARIESGYPTFYHEPLARYLEGRAMSSGG
jgi:activator of HSP90 ATPase